jgi:alcohol dehydrogenase YqhD (iron-dependent ADH family)
MIQIDGPNYALVTGATWNASTKVLTMTGTPTIANHSVVILEKSGNQTFIPNCQLITPASLVLGGKTHKKLPFTLRAFPVADDASVVWEMYIP